MARTAYEEALLNISNGDSPPANSSLPSYMVTADTLNVANNNQTFSEAFQQAYEDIPQFIAASIISGASQIYNIAPDVGNLFGGNFERIDTGEVIASLDSNLGAFYNEHQEGIDLVGFIASSILPGLGGIRVLNAGQKSLRAAIGAGKFGTNTGKALGLLAPQKSTSIAKAIKEVATNSSAASLSNRNALKAIGAGVGQNFLEALAFETAVTATLFNSPILENQDFGDFVTNVAFGAGVFGFIGGTVDAVKISSSLKRVADSAAIEARPWTFIDEAAKASKGYERVVLDFEQLSAMPKIPEGLDASRKIFLKQSADTKVSTLQGRIRRELGELAGGDQEVAETLFRAFKASSIQDQQSAFIGLVETTKFNATSKLAARAEKLAKKVREGKATVKEIDEFAESSIVVSYVKTWGEDIGKVVTEKPIITSLMDTLRGKQKIIVKKTGVKISGGGRSFPFNTKFNLGTKAGTKAAGRQWNPLTSDTLEAQARYIWTTKLPKFAPTAKSELTVNVNDIPLMEKVLFDVAEEDLKFVRFTGLEKGVEIGLSLQEFIGARKIIIANRILNIKGEAVPVVPIPKKAVVPEVVSRIALREPGLVSVSFTGTRPLFRRGHKEGRWWSDDINYTRLFREDKVAGDQRVSIDFSKLSILDSSSSPASGKFLTDKTEAQMQKSLKDRGYDAMLIKGENGENIFFLTDTIDNIIKSKELKLGLPSKIAPKVAKGEGALAQEEIAAIVNVKSSLLSGEVLNSPVSTFHVNDIFAMQHHAETYTKQLVAQGSRKETAGLVDIWTVPQTIKLTYDTTPFKGVNNHIVENMVIIKEQQRLYQDGTSRAAAVPLGRFFDMLPEITSGKVFSGAVPSGAGAGFASAASQNYGTLAEVTNFIGQVTSRAIRAGQDRARETLEPLLYKLGTNQEAAVEWNVLNQRVRAIEGNYGLNKAGDALEPVVLIRWQAAAEDAVAAGKAAPARPVLANPAMEFRIEIANQEVRDLSRAHIEVNAVRTNGLAGIRTSQGVQFNRAPDAFYPIPIDPKDFPHFATVTDESITSGNHTKTLFASTSEELEGMIKKLKENPHLKIRTKAEAEQHFKDVGQFDYEKTLSNNYLDVEAHRKGVSSPFIVATDPQKITSDALKWHMQRESGLVREAVAAKYEVQFEELRRLGDEFTNIATSKFSDQSLVKFAEDAAKNPFGDYIKTALGIRKTADYPWWTNVNQMADVALSRVLKRATAVVEKSKTDKELAAVNRMLEKAGYKGAGYDPDMEIFKGLSREEIRFANIEPAKGALSAVVQKANSILATVVLRWDSLNAVNNAVSANVLLGAETKAVVRAIGRGDEEAVGALAKLTRIAVPGTGETIFAPTKLIANAIRKFNRNSAEMQFFRDNGYMTSISDQYRNSLDSLTFTGKESVKSWDTRVNKLHDNLRKAADAGERFTGNRLAEEFNRFVAADVMKQMTDVGVKRGLITNQEQLAYINTFVNRTQGNYLAAQRPMMFQGPIGQAIGLFQTYQFNLMQQLLRHVGEGHGKDAMTLLALQGTIHGMNGLPAFNAINTHLIGTASGNTNHRDAYDAVYGIAGKEAGDWLMYGMASNAMGLLHPDLKINLYTRGDINPRHLTIVPTDPSQVAIVQATGKVFGNIFNVANRLAAGGDVSTTLLQGLEHNGISRPLAGLAQTLEGLDNPLAASYSTSKRGNVVAANDFLSLTNLTRVIGGKPLDEAIALDATYRFKSYGLADAKRRQVLGQAIKSTMIAGQNPTQDQIEQFALDYAKLGGRQEEFNRWFTQLYKTANLSQANEIQRSLRSPFTQSMQKIMGGQELRDFNE